ncbi:MAG: 3,4-dihydroxy-2-butanone-4-phosphate synthase [Candidatus Kariarchaeaceae archaeon]|jgi:3,4-dihydroxy 2-butanone 4-phosphate synthase
MSSLDQIRQAWEDGKFILLFDSDSREGEVDMVIPSEVVKPHHISTLRNDAGGLICTALSHEISDLLGLPYITDIYEMGNSQLNKMLNHGLPYGARSSFSVAINHVKSFTGITDNDRALTIRELGHMAQKFVNDELTPDVFASKFRIPGHVPLLRGREGLIANRQGHTELSLVLCALTGFAPSATMCEMMDSKSFNALSIEDARAYAEAHDYPYIDGKTVETLWRMVH